MLSIRFKEVNNEVLLSGIECIIILENRLIKIFNECVLLNGYLMEETKQNDPKIVCALRNRDHALCELVVKLIIICINPLKHSNYNRISISDYQIMCPSAINSIYNLHNPLLAN